MTLELSGLAACAFTHQVVSPAPSSLFHFNFIMIMFGFIFKIFYNIPEIKVMGFKTMGFLSLVRFSYCFLRQGLIMKLRPYNPG